MMPLSSADSEDLNLPDTALWYLLTGSYFLYQIGKTSLNSKKVQMHGFCTGLWVLSCISYCLYCMSQQFGLLNGCEEEDYRAALLGRSGYFGVFYFGRTWYLKHRKCGWQGPYSLLSNTHLTPMSCRLKGSMRLVYADSFAVNKKHETCLGRKGAE